MADSTFIVGGLSTGMDSQSIIDKLVSVQQGPLTKLQSLQTAYKSQVSALGDLASKLQALQTAAADLGSGGVLGVTTTSSNTTFSAVPGTNAAAGSYDVQVRVLASAAKWRSGPFAAGATLQAGTFTVTVGADHWDVSVAEGATLGELAADLQASGAPISASALDDGTDRYLSIKASQTGYPLDGAPGDALAVAFAPTAAPDPNRDPTTGGTMQDPVNATFAVDGLTFTRRSNTVTDALPGVTLTLKAGGGVTAPTETLALANDTAATKAKLQKYVDAYNAVLAAVQKQLAVSEGTDRTRTLAGDSTVRGLQRALEALGYGSVGGGTVRSLADLGVKTARDGSLGIDDSVLSAAIAREPSSVNTIFADATSGISGLVTELSDTYAASTTGLLSIRSQNLNKQISTMDDEAIKMQARLDAYRQQLVDQYAVMEALVGQYKSIGTFLTQQSNALAAKSS